MDWLLQNWPLLAAIATGLLTLFFLLSLSREQHCPYALRESLLTRNEQRFYAALLPAVSEDWDIFAMVRLADIIRVQAETDKRQAWQNRINCKHVDFVLCDHDNLQPVLAIEVDDKSHQRPDRRRRDEFLNDALEQANLPLLRIEAAAVYEARSIREQIDALVSPATTPRSRKSDKPKRRRKRTSRPKTSE